MILRDNIRILRILIIFIIIFLIFTITLIFFKELILQNPENILKSISEKNFNKKELNFKLDFAGMVPLGTITIEDKGLSNLEAKALRNFKGFVRILPFLSIFGLKAECELNSYADPESLNTLFYQEKTRISLSPVEQKELKYDQVQHIMEGPEGKFSILPGTKDPLAVLFYLQRIKLELGKEFEFFLNTSKTNYRINSKVTDKKYYILNNKNFRLWILESSIEEYGRAVSRHYVIFRFWILESYNNIPIRFEVDTRYGFFVGYLSD